MAVYNTILFIISLSFIIWTIMVYKDGRSIININMRKNVKDSELDDYMQNVANNTLHMALIFFVMFLFNLLIDISIPLKFVANISFLLHV